MERFTNPNILKEKKRLTRNVLLSILLLIVAIALVAFGYYMVEQAKANTKPLVRSDLEKLIQCAKYNHINTIVTTNTTLLNDKNIEALKLADLVQISVDGPKEIHNEQRQSDAFDQTIENIKKLKQAGCKIRLNSFIYNSNKQYVDYLINLSKELDLFSII